MPVFNTLAQYILAAASGNRDSLIHLVLAIASSARTAIACIGKYYQAHPRALTPVTLARIQYIAARLKAIFYTLRHAPERFLTPAQLRALIRTQAVLSRIWHQPVDFTPLVPILTSPDACPPPPRSVVVAPASCRHEPGHTPRSALRTSSSSPANPLLLRNPGCALASVFLQIAAIYGLSTTPAPRPATSSSVPSAPSRLATQSMISNNIPDASLSSRSDLRAPHSENPQSFPHSPP